MNEDMLTTARQLAAHPDWEWRPGMRWCFPRGGRGISAEDLNAHGCDAGRVLAEEEGWGAAGAPDGAVPDLTDDATGGTLMGALLPLISQPHIHVSTSGKCRLYADQGWWAGTTLAHAAAKAWLAVHS